MALDAVGTDLGDAVRGFKKGLNGDDGAPALGLEGVVGNLQPGCEADFLVIDPRATPLLARKTALAQNLEELLFSMIVLGDDRLIERTVISQAG